MRFAGLVVLAVLPFCLHAAVVVSGGQPDNYLHEDAVRAGRSDDSTAAGNWAMVTKIAEECARDADTAACLAVKTATALDRASRIGGNVQVFPGLTVAKNADEGSQRDSRALPTEEELRSQLTEPTAADHTSKVTDLVLNSALRFLQSRTLKFNFPQTNAEELSRAIEEGNASY